MRSLGKLFNLQHAQRFVDFLYLQGIEAEFDEDDKTLWIADEDQLDAAGEHLSRFKANPDASEFQDVHLDAERKREEEDRADERAAEQSFTSRDVFKKLNSGAFGLRNKPGPLTWTLIGVSVAITFLTMFGSSEFARQWLYMAKLNFTGNSIRWAPSLLDIRNGQLWRLITPIFVHLDIFHIFFNMWWLADLGAMIERRRGLRSYIPLVLVTAIGSNLAQFCVESLIRAEAYAPYFGGMSGVVFGLFGYVFVMQYVAGKKDFLLSKFIIYFMLGWLVLGFVVPAMQMANWAHFGGLMIGYLYAQAELNLRQRD